MGAYSRTGRKLQIDVAIHPGEILKDELESRNIKQKDFAHDISMSPTQFNEILAGKRSISPEVAILLESALGIRAKFWLDMQTDYELEAARINELVQKKSEAVNIWNVIKKCVCIPFLKKQGELEGDTIENVEKIKEIYGTNSVEGIIAQQSNPIYAKFRKSENLQTDKINLITWVKYVEYLASSIQVPAYDPEKLPQLIAELKQIFLATNIVENSQKCFNKYGIKFIVQEKPERVSVDGISFWAGANPVIAITQRYKRVDNFVFTVFHELAHLALHLKGSKDIFIDSLDELDSDDYHEREANNFASDALIDPILWNQFVENNTKFDDKTISQFADRVGVLPAIVRGRLCNQSIVSYKSTTDISYLIL